MRDRSRDTRRSSEETTKIRNDAKNFFNCLNRSGNVDKLAALKAAYPLLGVEEVN